MSPPRGETPRNRTFTLATVIGKEAPVHRAASVLRASPILFPEVSILQSPADPPVTDHFTAEELENSFPIDASRRFRTPSGWQLVQRTLDGMRAGAVDDLGLWVGQRFSRGEIAVK